jgi:hypothetical protein
VDYLVLSTNLHRTLHDDGLDLAFIPLYKVEIENSETKKLGPFKLVNLSCVGPQPGYILPLNLTNHPGKVMQPLNYVE